MSTRSLIAKQIAEDEYLTIYCHSDGYLEHNGALLLDHYNTPEKVDELLALGDLSILGKYVKPDPNIIYANRRDQIKDGVTFAYARDGGEPIAPPSTYTLRELMAMDVTPFVYIYTKNHEWKYRGEMSSELQDVKENLDVIYDKHNVERPEGCYNRMNRRVAIQMEGVQTDNDEVGETQDFDHVESERTTQMM